MRENVLVEGEAPQNVMRWEDFTQTAVDPRDDCTIWYGGDYLKKGETNYTSRISGLVVDELTKCQKPDRKGRSRE